MQWISTVKKDLDDAGITQADIAVIGKPLGIKILIEKLVQEGKAQEDWNSLL